MTDPELDVASLISRIKQLEEQQNIMAQYALKVKHQLEELTEQFNDLQQRFSQLPTLSNSLNSVDTTNAPTESVSVDDAEVVRQFFERVDQQQRQEAIALTASSQNSELLGNPAEVEVNADTVEVDQVQETDTTAPEESTTAFNDQEFKLERVMWLLNRIYTAEKETQEIPISAEEFLERFKKGEKDFTEINLARANLRGQSLNKGINLSNANLREAELCEANLSSANLDEANLANANLYKAKLDSAKLVKANLIPSLCRRGLSAEFDSESIDYGVSFSIARHQSVNKKRQRADGRRQTADGLIPHRPEFTGD